MSETKLTYKEIGELQYVLNCWIDSEETQSMPEKYKEDFKLLKLKLIAIRAKMEYKRFKERI